MAYLRHRPYFRKKRRVNWVWYHQVFNNASPSATLNTIDLLTNWRAQMGITIALPDITIWRVRIRISVIVTAAAAVVSQDGFLTTLFVDSQNQAQLNYTASNLSQHFMWYQAQYLTQALEMDAASGVLGTYGQYEEIDCKAHRRMEKNDDTLFLQIVAMGGASIANLAYQQSTLLRIS